MSFLNESFSNDCVLVFMRNSGVVTHPDLSGVKDGNMYGLFLCTGCNNAFVITITMLF